MYVQQREKEREHDPAREVHTEEGTAIFVLDRLVDVFFIMDIFFNFFTVGGCTS